jgi:hypothetical protein
MKIHLTPQHLSVLSTCLAALALPACSATGDGLSEGDGGAGGSTSQTSGKSTGAGTTATGAGATSSGAGAASTGAGAASSGSSTGSGSTGGSNVIDDMEDKDGAIANAQGRQGFWYTYNDKTPGSMQTPEAGSAFTMVALAKPRTGSMFAANMTGSGFNVYGAGMGFDLNAVSMKKSAYDASMFTGISFYAMAGAGGTQSVRINVLDKNTAPEGGVCTKCDDHFGTNITLTEEWQQFTLKFNELKQQNFGDPQPAVTPSALYAIQIQVGTKVTFDVWIDDVAFVK